MAAAREVKRHAIAGEGTSILVARTIYIVFAVIVVLIVSRMVLLLMGVGLNANPLANILYRVTEVSLMPFFFIFGYQPTYGAPVFEIGALVGLIVYVLLGWGLGFLATYGSWHSDDV